MQLHQTEHAEADYLKDFIEKDVFCVDFAIKEGQPALDLEVTNGNHVWTPVHVMKPNVLLDELVEPHAVDIPVSELSKFCLLYTSPSPRDATLSRMPSSA